MTLGRCPLSIFCYCGTPPNPESITTHHNPAAPGYRRREYSRRGTRRMTRPGLRPTPLHAVFSVKKRGDWHSAPGTMCFERALRHSVVQHPIPTAPQPRCFHTPNPTPHIPQPKPQTPNPEHLGTRGASTPGGERGGGHAQVAQVSLYWRRVCHRSPWFRV